MMALLVFKEKLRTFYNKYEIYVTPALKFLMVLITLGVIGKNIGCMTKLNELPVVLIVSLLASFLPLGLVVLIVLVIVLAHLYAISLELMCVTLLLFLIMYLLYFRLTPRDGLVILLMPVLFFLKIPYVMPIAVGLLCTPVSVVSVVFATLICYVMQYAADNTATLANMSTELSAEKFNIIISGIFTNKEMYLSIIAFFAVVILVYAIKRKAVNNSWAISIIVGGVVNSVIMIGGGMVLNVYSMEDVLKNVIFTIVSVILAFGLQFFAFSVDYSRTEHTQFEDDDYYYYVKAVPKTKVTATEVNVKRINARKAKKVKTKKNPGRPSQREEKRVIEDAGEEQFSFDD